MEAPCITVNGIRFPVLNIRDVSMLDHAQKKHCIHNKTWRVETHIPFGQDRLLTPNVCMVAFFTHEPFKITDNMSASAILIEKNLDGAARVLESYSYDGNSYTERPFFTWTLQGFLNCTAFLYLGLYIMKTIINVYDRSVYTVYFVDKAYLNNTADENNEVCDTSLEKFLESQNV